MKNDDIKFLIYTIVGCSFNYAPFLSIEIKNEFVSDDISTDKNWKDYQSKKVKLLTEEIKRYSLEEFNTFIENIIHFCKDNYGLEDSYFLPFKLFQYFDIVPPFLFFKKFMNPELIALLRNF